MEADVLPPLETVEPKTEAILTAAIAVFARYGYRKTSMEEVARAAGISRQGLYLVFSDKEALFRQAVALKLSQQLKTVDRELNDTAANIESRLVAACDAWSGRYIGMLGADAADLMCASTSLAGEILGQAVERFETALRRAVERSELAHFWARHGISATQLATILHATSRGLKQSCTTRQEFVQSIAVAARLLCGPSEDCHRGGGMTLV